MRDHFKSGVAAIEFALILPFLAIFLFGIIEFGMYFLKAQGANRAVSLAAHKILQNPRDMIKNDSRNFFQGTLCANAYDSLERAEESRCKTQWITHLSSREHYYVKVEAYEETHSISGLLDGVIPDIYVSQIIEIDMGQNCSVISLSEFGMCFGMVHAGQGLFYDYHPRFPVCTEKGWACEYGLVRECLGEMKDEDTCIKRDRNEDLKPVDKFVKERFKLPKR